MNYLIREDLKTIREILNLSQQQLAKEIGVSSMTIIRIENNDNYPNNDTINKIYNYAFKKNVKLNELKELYYREEIEDDKRLLFHGTKSMIEGLISPYVGREKLDFGKGFYCGETCKQTISFINKYPESSLYILSFDSKGLNYTRFNLDLEWMLAVSYYRGRLKEYHHHPLISKIIKKVESVDYIIAPIADNRMYLIINRFIDGEITDEQCMHSLIATDLGYQYIFLNEKATSKIEILERCYVSSYERDSYNQIREEEASITENNARLALTKYQNKGKYLKEILK